MRLPLLVLLASTLLGLAGGPARAAEFDYPAAFTARDLPVNGTTLHVRSAGTGPAVVLLHGFGETGHMWQPLVEQLAQRHTVIVPDLRGAGDSDKPQDGYDKKTLAVDIHELRGVCQLKDIKHETISAQTLLL